MFTFIESVSPNWANSDSLSNWKINFEPPGEVIFQTQFIEPG